jgi:hypothetical protein
MVSSKYSQTGTEQVQRDLRDNHRRSVSRNCIQSISRATAEVAVEKRQWHYTSGVSASEVSSIGVSLDGTCMLILEDGWRQAMAGSISLYDSQGERLHTDYTAHSPEYGKKTFYSEFTGGNRAYELSKCSSSRDSGRGGGQLDIS